MSSIIIFVINDSLAQLVEHLTLNQQVPGSSPGWVTILELLPRLTSWLFYLFYGSNNNMVLGAIWGQPK